MPLTSLLLLFPRPISIPSLIFLAALCSRSAGYILRHVLCSLFYAFLLSDLLRVLFSDLLMYSAVLVSIFSAILFTLCSSVLLCPSVLLDL